jgi:hypothetical protein
VPGAPEGQVGSSTDRDGHLSAVKARHVLEIATAGKPAEI